MASGFKDFFSNEFDTALSKDNETKTHSYGNDYNKVKEEVIYVLKKKGFNLINVDDKYCEILLESKKGSVICTINQVSYYENMVDFKVVTHYVFPCARAKKLVIALFEELNRKLTLKS